MSPTESRTRLERHRDDLTLARGLGSLITLEDLTEEELRLLNSAFFQRIRASEAKEIGQIYDAYVRTLHEWGVMCPHPLRQRKYEGWQASDVPLQYDESRWYECGLCQAAVINHWGK